MYKKIISDRILFSYDISSILLHYLSAKMSIAFYNFYDFFVDFFETPNEGINEPTKEYIITKKDK